MADSTALIPTYVDASDATVLRNYEAACAAEVRCHERGIPVSPLTASVCDAWMREGMRRGIL
jgi:hypothetical protein